MVVAGVVGLLILPAPATPPAARVLVEPGKQLGRRLDGFPAAVSPGVFFEFFGLGGVRAPVAPGQRCGFGIGRPARLVWWGRFTSTSPSAAPLLTGLGRRCVGSPTGFGGRGVGVRVVADQTDGFGPRVRPAMGGRPVLEITHARVAAGRGHGRSGVADRRLERRGSEFRLPVLAVALGIYLPLKLSAAICVGGLLAEVSRKAGGASDEPSRRGLLFAAGLITGEALMGIVLALPIALTTLWPELSADPFSLFSVPPLGGWPGLVVMGLVGALLYRAAQIPAGPR